MSPIDRDSTPAGDAGASTGLCAAERRDRWEQRKGALVHMIPIFRANVRTIPPFGIGIRTSRIEV